MKLERGEYGVFRLDREGVEIGQIVWADNKKEAVTKEKYDVRNAEFIEPGFYKVEIRNHGGEIGADFFVKQDENNVGDYVRSAKEAGCIRAQGLASPLSLFGSGSNSGMFRLALLRLTARVKCSSSN